MAILYSLCLQIIHSIYALYLLLSSFRERRQWKPPGELLRMRNRIPKHLALILKPSSMHTKESTKSALMQSVSNAASWCRKVGIRQLTVYEEHGLLYEYDRDIRCHLLEMSKDSTIDSDSSESEIEYRPLTPPPSDYSDSRPISPSQNTNPTIPLVKIVLSDSSNAKERPNRKSSLKRRTRGMEQGSTSASLTVCLMSHVASKSAIAAAASSLAKQHRFKQRKGKRTSSRTPFSLGVSEFEAMLEGEHGLSPPDFMIVHSFDAEDTHRRVPLELINFPPWHIRLTEIYQSRLGHIIGWPWKAPKSLCTAFPLDDISFREALDEFSGAEFRFGK